MIQKTIQYDDLANEVHFICERRIDYTIEGRGGDDVITSSVSTAGVSLFGGDGDDLLQVDRCSRSDGYNLLSGGEGSDTLVGSSSTDAFFIDRLDTVIDATLGDGDTVWSRASYTLGSYLEDLFLRGAGNRIAIGNAQANTIVGNSGDNILRGLARPDFLEGGGGHDTLVGGAGADRLLAGTESTVIDYNRATESGPRAWDVIQSLDSNDLIDLSDIDANPGSAIDDAFTFIGAAAFGADATGQIRCEAVDDDHTMLFISMDADADAEMQIELAFSVTPAASNFIL